MPHILICRPGSVSVSGSNGHESSSEVHGEVSNGMEVSMFPCMELVNIYINILYIKTYMHMYMYMYMYMYVYVYMYVCMYVWRFPEMGR